MQRPRSFQLLQWGFTNKAVDEHRGWMFDPTYPGSTTDPLFGAATLRSVYEQAAAAGGAPAPTKFSVPLLVDTVTRRIVNNESSEILRMLPLFERFATPGTIAIDLYPEPLRPIIDQRSDLICEWGMVTITQRVSTVFLPFRRPRYQ